MPISTNLGLVTPTSAGFVTNGAVDMQTLANGVDAFYGVMTAYTPTYTNCSGPVMEARYRKIGRMLHVMIDGTAGTVTAAGTITISLPPGLTSLPSRTPVCAEFAGTGVVHAWVVASGTAITVSGTAAGGNFAAGANLSNLALNFVTTVTT